MFQRRRKKYRLLEDPELISLYRESQDRDAFAAIYERYGHLVLGTCMKYLKDESEAQDLTSHIFEELGARLLRHTVENFKGWLYRLTKNECLMFLRKQKHHLIYTIQIEALSEDDRDSKTKQEQQLTLLETSLEALKPDQQQCIRLFYLENKSYQEVSDLLKLDVKQVKSAIQNGKRNLKLTLLQHDEFRE